MPRFIHICLVFSMFSSVLLFGQTTEQLNKFHLAENFGVNSNFSKAQHLIDSLLNHLEKEKTRDDKFELRLQQLKGNLYEHDNENNKAILICLKVVDKAEIQNYCDLAFFAHLTLALVNEKTSDLKTCNKHLELANLQYLKCGLDTLYANYCIRKASYFRFNNQEDSAIFYSKLGLTYAKKYNQSSQIYDSNMLLGILLGDSLPQEAIQHFSVVAHAFIEKTNFFSASFMFNNISRIYFKEDNLGKSLSYNDSAIYIGSLSTKPLHSSIYNTRAEIYEKTAKIDSALFYRKKELTAFKSEVEQENLSEIINIKEQFENDKLDNIIENQIEVNKSQKNVLLMFIVFVISIAIASMFLYRTNRKVKKQAKVLTNSLKQKDILLGEVKHRVKNNLQLIIGLLDFQNEKATVDNIKAITLENQNRIKAMAFVHDKVYLSNDLEHVDFQSYLKEITTLVRSSYFLPDKNIVFDIHCEVNELNINKSISLGLIVLELINNSFKHAFKNQNEGIVQIKVTKNKNSNFTYKLYYKDNGSGFKTLGSGIGIEVVNGLVGQLEGKVEMINNNGFEAIIYF